MENIFHRVSIRKYEDKPVEKEKILQILKAGMQAPSACNQQPWEFYVVTDKEKIRELSKATPYSGCAAGAPQAAESESAFDIPDKRPGPLHPGRSVHFAEGVHQRSHLLVVDDGQDRGVHRRPRMRAVVGFAVDRAAALGQGPFGEAADTLLVEDGVHPVGQRLVV